MAAFAVAVGRMTETLGRPERKGVAGNFPLARSGMALGKVAPRSGFAMELRYRVRHVVSTVSSMRLVSRPIWRAPGAVLLGMIRKWPRLTGSAPLDAR